jgi:hypothetical protein
VIKEEKKSDGIAEWFRNQIQKQRWLLFIFTSEGLEIKRVLFYPTSQKVLERTPIFFKNVTEQTIRSNKILKIIPHILFFPFKYRISVIASRPMCSSKYFSFPYSRKKPGDIIDSNEIAGVFSRFLWRTLEINKKEFSKANSYDDLSVLLVNNQVVSASIDGKYFSRPDAIFEKTGKKISLGIVQTFAYRPFFSSLAKIIPKRAVFRDFYEYGFNLPLSVTLKHLQTSKKSNKKFIFAGVDDNETRIYEFNGTALNFHDTFPFGSRSFYQAMNHIVGVDYAAYRELQIKISNKDLAPFAYKKLKEVLDKELSGFYNGLSSFKKSCKAGTIYVDGEKINDYLKTNNRFSGMLISDSYCEQHSKVDLSEFDALKEIRADVGCSIGLMRNDQINMMATKQIRWLLPHSMELK